MAEQLRAEGNSAFNRGELSRACELYTSALAALAAPAYGTAPAPELAGQRAVVLANRALVRLKQGAPGEALVDAEAAVREDPLYLKAHERRTAALLGLGKVWRARMAYREAELSFKDSQPHTAELAYVRSKLKSLAAQCEAEDRKGPVESREHWDEIARYMPTKAEPRIRLALMATWWNLSSQDERLTIFKRFLAVLTGKEEAALDAELAAIPADTMVPLPMENYADLTVPKAWTDFYEPLDALAKLVLFQNMYGSCNQQEKNLIARDLKEFFPPPSR